jgi:hypothetical protein
VAYVHAFHPSFVALQQTEEWRELAARDVRMEVDYATVTECKEGGDGAHLQVLESDDSNAADSIDHGQMQIAYLRQLPPSCN